ncbi:hypothetical protein CDIK_0250 [Cucumispora dikerogammari]|nr:hypothetical protein CDIK_0250 [Cucumispora dikerogammari]
MQKLTSFFMNNFFNLLFINANEDTNTDEPARFFSSLELRFDRRYKYISQRNGTSTMEESCTILFSLAFRDFIEEKYTIQNELINKEIRIEVFSKIEEGKYQKCEKSDLYTIAFGEEERLDVWYATKLKTYQFEIHQLYDEKNNPIVEYLKNNTDHVIRFIVTIKPIVSQDKDIILKSKFVQLLKLANSFELSNVEISEVKEKRTISSDKEKSRYAVSHNTLESDSVVNIDKLGSETDKPNHSFITRSSSRFNSPTTDPTTNRSSFNEAVKKNFNEKNEANNKKPWHKSGVKRKHNLIESSSTPELENKKQHKRLKKDLKKGPEQTHPLGTEAYSRTVCANCITEGNLEHQTSDKKNVYAEQLEFGNYKQNINLQTDTLEEQHRDQQHIIQPQKRTLSGETDTLEEITGAVLLNPQNDCSLSGSQLTNLKIDQNGESCLNDTLEKAITEHKDSPVATKKSIYRNPLSEFTEPLHDNQTIAPESNYPGDETSEELRIYQLFSECDFKIQQDSYKLDIEDEKNTKETQLLKEPTIEKIHPECSHIMSLKSTEQLKSGLDTSSMILNKNETKNVGTQSPGKRTTEVNKKKHVISHSRKKGNQIHLQVQNDHIFQSPGEKKLVNTERLLYAEISELKASPQSLKTETNQEIEFGSRENHRIENVGQPTASLLSLDEALFAGTSTGSGLTIHESKLKNEKQFSQAIEIFKGEEVATTSNELDFTKHFSSSSIKKHKERSIEPDLNQSLGTRKEDGCSKETSPEETIWSKLSQMAVNLFSKVAQSTALKTDQDGKNSLNYIYPLKNKQQTLDLISPAPKPLLEETCRGYESASHETRFRKQEDTLQEYETKNEKKHTLIKPLSPTQSNPVLKNSSCILPTFQRHQLAEIKTSKETVNDLSNGSTVYRSPENSQSTELKGNQNIYLSSNDTERQENLRRNTSHIRTTLVSYEEPVSESIKKASYTTRDSINFDDANTDHGPKREYTSSGAIRFEQENKKDCMLSSTDVFETKNTENFKSFNILDANPSKNDEHTLTKPVGKLTHSAERLLGPDVKGEENSLSSHIIEPEFKKQESLTILADINKTDEEISFEKPLLITEKSNQKSKIRRADGISFKYLILWCLLLILLLGLAWFMAFGIKKIKN